MHFTEINWDALYDLVPFLKFKKCEKQPWMSVNFFMGSFHVFQIVQQVPNRAKYHNSKYKSTAKQKSKQSLITITITITFALKIFAWNVFPRRFCGTFYSHIEKKKITLKK